MIEVAPRLYVGTDKDFQQLIMPERWGVVHACKEPYHRMALGYTKQGAPKDHPEYLYAVRNGHLILNLVDVEDPKYVAKQIIEAHHGTITVQSQAGNGSIFRVALPLPEMSTVP